MHKDLRIPERTHLTDPGPGAPMTSATLGTHLAHMCWESLGSFLESDVAADLLDAAGARPNQPQTGERVGEELLIFHLWIHARALRDAFRSRSDDPGLRTALKAFHSAGYADVVEQGIPKAELPILEERVSQRYIEYHRARERSEEAVVRALLGHLGIPSDEADVRVEGMVTHLREVTDPLLDFLVDLEVH
jgi:hypothetical protein